MRARHPRRDSRSGDAGSTRSSRSRPGGRAAPRTYSGRRTGAPAATAARRPTPGRSIRGVWGAAAGRGADGEIDVPEIVSARHTSTPLSQQAGDLHCGRTASNDAHGECPERSGNVVGRKLPGSKRRKEVGDCDERPRRVLGKRWPVHEEVVFGQAFERGLDCGSGRLTEHLDDLAEGTCAVEERQQHGNEHGAGPTRKTDDALSVFEHDRVVGRGDAVPGGEVGKLGITPLRRLPTRLSTPCADSVRAAAATAAGAAAVSAFEAYSARR